MSDEKRTWYQRTHQFTPYTKADGTAVSDEFDAIQASFERIPAMRDDGKGFATSPLIPEPSDPNHPVPFKMLTETEASVNNARDDVTKKAQQVAHNAQSVATNTQTTINQAKSASQSAESASASSRSASNSEEMARKWASNPVNEVVQGDKYSSYHYATKAEQSATTASSAAVTSKSNADIATSKAEEAVQAANRATSIANGEVEYSKVINVPSANTKTKGIVQLTSSIESDSEELGLTAKAGKYLASLIAKIHESLVGYIKTSSMSSRVDSDSAENVATSAAVKTAYDKGVEAKNAADNANNNALMKTGGVVTGNTSFKQGDWSGIDFYNNSGRYVRIESNPHSSNSMLSFVYRESNGSNINVASLPRRDGNILLDADFTYQKIGNFEVRKYPDGTMIQTYVVQKSDIENGKYSAFYWAQSFLENPMIFTKIITSYNGAHDCGINVVFNSNNTNNAMCLYCEYEHGEVNQGLVKIQFLAIGRWK